MAARFADYEDIKARYTGGNGKDHHAKAGRFNLIPFDDVELDPEPPWLVERLIPRVGLSVAWGPPKCGKTFLVSDLALHVAMGWTYRDRDVQQGAVVYVVAEGARGFKARVVAWRNHHSPQGVVPFYVVAASLDLIGEHAELVAAIRAQLGDVEPALVVIDTLNRTLRGSESKDEDMGAFIVAADAVRDAFNCAVLVVHHSGLDATRPRGHTSLAGAVDAQISVRREKGGPITATVELMKDGEEGDAIVSRLRPVTVGTDAKGHDVTSCIIEPSDEEPAAAGANLTPRERDWLATITNWFARPEIEIPFVIPVAGGRSFRSSSREQIRDWLRHCGCIDVPPGVPLDAKQRKDLFNTLNALRRKNKIGMTDRYVWLLK